MTRHSKSKLKPKNVKNTKNPNSQIIKKPTLVGDKKLKNDWIKLIWIPTVLVLFCVVLTVYLLENPESRKKASLKQNIITESEENVLTVESHQNVSLRKPYAVDYAEVLRIRNENMAKYSYNYNKFGIDKRSNLSLQEFRDVYDGKWPVVITDVVPKWEASKWSGKYLNDSYGNERIAMKAVSKGLRESEMFALPLHLFYKNVHKTSPTMWNYIEDELFLTMKPELKNQIGDNIYMEEDYFQLFPDEVQPWNAMLLWGTKYSRSSLHMDPYNWTGTNAVLMGRKRWRLYPPGQDINLYIMLNVKSGFPLDCLKYNSIVDAYEPDRANYPRFKKATALEFDQLPGEILFIPTGWYHQAYNVEETMAISSQMTNRNNYRIVLEEIMKVDNINRKDLPDNIDSLSPAEQVMEVMKLLPQHLLDHGKAVTEDAINQVQFVK